MNRTIHSVDAAALVANEAGGVVLLIEKMSSCLAGLKEVTVENSKNDGKHGAGRTGDRPSSIRARQFHNPVDLPVHGTGVRPCKSGDARRLKRSRANA
jgi:hypothetical protein